MYIPNANDYSLGYYESVVEFKKVLQPKLKTLFNIFKTKAVVKNNKAEKNVAKNGNAYC